MRGKSQSAIRFTETDDPYFRETLDGLYRIAKVIVGGRERYEVWHKKGINWHGLKYNMTHQEAVEYVIYHSESKS